jgi:hypothetical protein
MRYLLFWDLMLQHWVFDSRHLETTQWSHLQGPTVKEAHILLGHYVPRTRGMKNTGITLGLL